MDRTRSLRQERQRRREVLGGRFRRSESSDRLTIIPSPSVESVTAESAVGRSRDGVLELASSRTEVPEPVLNHRSRSWSRRMRVWTLMMGNMRAMMARVRRARRARRRTS